LFFFPLSFSSLNFYLDIVKWKAKSVGKSLMCSFYGGAAAQRQQEATPVKLWLIYTAPGGRRILLHNIE